MEISSHNQTGDGSGPREARSLRDPDHVANYRIIEEIGRGGQGIVFLAEDLRNGKRVALKVLRDRGAISSESLERLRREVEAVARLSHPCICGVHEAVLDGPNPFIAMNYVSGRTLAKAIETEQRGDDKTLVIRRDGSGSGERSPSEDALKRKGPSSRQDILRLVGVIEKVARALHVAHEARVIHRDIKPANIMLTAAGDPVILDFGLAHFEESGLEKLTKAGEIWGTVEYLSPEQLVGNRMKVDRRTDIWSLGVTLYECLTMRRPFEGPTSNQIFHSIQAKDPPDPCRINPALPVDVRVVIETALEKDRDRRYETAQAFADDLKAICEGRQIAARPIGRITRVTRWAKRNPGVATSLLVTFGVLVTGIVVAAVLLVALKRSLADTKHALRRVDEESVKKDSALKQSKSLRLLAESSAILPRDPALAMLLAQEGGSLARDKLALTNGALIDALADLREHETLLGHLRPVETAEFSPDGSRVVTTAGGEIRIWDVKTGSTIATLSHPRVAFAAFTPHGGFLVAFSLDGLARIWDARSWEEVARFGDRDASDGNGGATSTRRADGAAERLRDYLPGILAVTLSADASRVLTVRDREATVWDPETGAKISSLAKPLGPIASIVSITFSFDSSRILTVANGIVTVWDTSSGREIATAPDPIRASRVTFSPDGTRVVALSPDRGQVWSVKDGHVLDLKETSVSVDSVQFSADGKRLVVINRNGIRAWDLEKETSKEICGPDATRTSTNDPNADLSRPDATFTRDGRVVSASCHGTAHVWNADTGQQSAVLSGPAGDVRFISVSPKGDFVLTAASTGTATLWDTVNWLPTPLRGHSGEITHASFSADGSLVVTASADRTARIWHTRNCPGAPLLDGNQGAITEIAFSPDGRLILTASSDGMPRLWRSEDASLVRALSAKKKTLSQPQLSPDGTRVLARGDEGSAVVLSVETGDVTATIRGDLDASEFTHAAFSPDGRLIVTASDEGIVYVWDAATGQEKSRYAGHRGTVIFSAFCGGGARIVTAASDRTVCFWNPADGTEIAVHQGHAEQPPVVGPRGDRVAVVAPDGTIRICDGRTGQAVSTLTGKRHAAPRFSPDGARIVTQSPQGSFKIWDVASGAEIASFPRDEGDSVQGFSPDSTMILTSAKDGNVWVWEAATGSREHAIHGHGVPVTSAGYSPDGRFVVVSWWDETRLFDSDTADDLWSAPRRHGSIRFVRFSPDSKWLAVGHAGGVVRLWPSDPLAKAVAIQPRELTLEELDAHEIDDDAARKKLRILFSEDMTNEDLVTTLERRDGLSPRLRSAAIAAARARDPSEVARRLCRKAWNDVLAPYGARDHYFTALRRAEIALGLDPGVELGRTTLGAAQYRAGLAGAALATLEQAAKEAPHASTSIFIGMAHARLGQFAEAQTALANARSMLDSSGNYPDEIRRLLTEAESLCHAESRPG